MNTGPALYLGKVGTTGTSTGPHAHWEVMKEGKRFGLSQARSDIGQYLQFKKPGATVWENLYSKQGGGFTLNPGAALNSPMGMRTHPVYGDQRMHGGEDYAFPEGTQLRFLGPGSVATHANRGGAGNVSSLRTGPYELQTFHLSELPGSSTTRGKAQETETAQTTEEPKADSASFDVLLNSLIEDQLMSQMTKNLFTPKASKISQFSQLLEMFPTGAMYNPLVDAPRQQQQG
jgi:murein DD-endopeptidase MepM/ murein hydrolase activator NlpD